MMGVFTESVCKNAWDICFQALAASNTRAIICSKGWDFNTHHAKQIAYVKILNVIRIRIWNLVSF
jgi:hypothetical protein